MQGRQLEDGVKFDRDNELELLIALHDATRDLMGDCISDHASKQQKAGNLTAESPTTLYVKIVEQNAHDTLSRIQHGRMMLANEYESRQNFRDLTNTVNHTAQMAVSVSEAGLGAACFGIVLTIVLTAMTYCGY